MFDKGEFYSYFELYRALVKNQLRVEIDNALDVRDEQKFMELTTALISLG